MLTDPTRLHALLLAGCCVLLQFSRAAGQVVQQAYLKASNTDAGDLFGHSVAVSGDTMVIGAYQESSGATGVNGDQRDNGTLYAGAAYVFVRSGTSWTQEAYLKASNSGWRDRFGYSVAISEDVVVVGAYTEESDATGVNGDPHNDRAPYAGAAYVFVRDGTSWSQEAYLKASNTDAGDRFGCAVAVWGDIVVVGANREESGATGVNGDEGDNGAHRAGAAYVFRRRGTSWSQEAYLKASNTDWWDSFGSSVSISGNTVAVGAWGERSGATGVNGDQHDNSRSRAGAAYVFARSGTSWSQQAYVKASNTDSQDEFGSCLALFTDTLVVGAPFESSGATGVNGDQNNNGASAAGAAYVFLRSGPSWSQEAYLKASNTEPEDFFGSSLAVSANTIVVGAWGEDSSATGVNGDQRDNSVLYAGAVYLFGRDGSDWRQETYVKASNPGVGDNFSCSVAVFDNELVVGAAGENSGATGVNGDQSDESAQEAGAAYAFDIDVPPGVPFCFGDPGVGTPCPCSNDNDGSVPGSGCANGTFASGARLRGSGVASVSDDTLVLWTTGLDPRDFGLYYQADNPLAGGDGVAFGDGLRCARGGMIHLEYRRSNAAGVSSTTIALAAAGGVTPGDTKRYQCWYRDNSGAQPCGVGVNDFNLSNGYEVLWRP